MKKVITGFAYCQPASSWEVDQSNVVDGFRFNFIHIDPVRMGGDYIPAGTATLTIESPDNFDPRGGAVELLNERKKEIMAEFQARMNEIDKQISQYTAIEYVEAV
jgi:hypothetical protein